MGNHFLPQRLAKEFIKLLMGAITGKKSRGISMIVTSILLPLTLTITIIFMLAPNVPGGFIVHLMAANHLNLLVVDRKPVRLI